MTPRNILVPLMKTRENETVEFKHTTSPYLFTPQTRLLGDCWVAVSPTRSSTFSTILQRRLSLWHVSICNLKAHSRHDRKSQNNMPEVLTMNSPNSASPKKLQFFPVLYQCLVEWLQSTLVFLLQKKPTATTPPCSYFLPLAIQTYIFYFPLRSHHRD